MHRNYIYVYAEKYTYKVIISISNKDFHPKNNLPPLRLGGQVRSRRGGNGPRGFRGHWRKGGTVLDDDRPTTGVV